jgi:O-antigen/teichoic acid export membrane protein
MRLSRLVAGLDAGQLVAVAARATQIGAGLVTLLLVGACFDPRLQGYFYTFSSLIALQVLAEVGLGTVLLQFVAHEMAGVRWNGQVLEGGKSALQRLRNVTRFAIAWFGCGAVGLVAVLAVVGQFFFGGPVQEEALPAGIWWSWLLLVLGTGVSLFTSAMGNLLEGSGKVTEVAAVRLVQHLLGAIAAWGAILLGAGLAALALQTLVVAATGIAYLFTKRAAWRALRTLREEDAPLDWRREILPFQWRIAVSWLCGYFIFQAFTPALFIWAGPEAAGRMGMSMQLFSAISSICIILVTARSPTFGRLVADRDWETLDRLFRVSFVQSLALLSVLLTMLALVLWGAMSAGFAITSRLLPAQELGILAAAVVGSHLVTAQATYLRAHKQEPFMRLAVLNAALISALSLWSIPHHGATGAAWTYGAVTLLVSLPLGTLIFRRFRAEMTPKPKVP